MDGGVRKLGIPTVLDRFIQQAVMQVLQRRWDPTFSEPVTGSRPKRSAHQAVAKAQQYIAAGHGGHTGERLYFRPYDRAAFRFRVGLSAEKLRALYNHLSRVAVQLYPANLAVFSHSQQDRAKVGRNQRGTTRTQTPRVKGKLDGGD